MPLNVELTHTDRHWQMRLHTNTSTHTHTLPTSGDKQLFLCLQWLTHLPVYRACDQLAACVPAGFCCIRAGRPVCLVHRCESSSHSLFSLPCIVRLVSFGNTFPTVLRACLRMPTSSSQCGRGALATGSLLMCCSLVVFSLLSTLSPVLWQ